MPVPDATSSTFGQLPALLLRAPDGAQARLTLYGAHLVSWRSADGQEHLFCSACSALDGSKAIRGGVPLIFPQFAQQGTGLRHGFARVSTWRVRDTGVSDGWAFATLELSAADLAPSHAQAWPHAFTLRLRVAVRGAAIEIGLELENTGATPFAFAAALHSYFLVDDLARASILGLGPDALVLHDHVDQIHAEVAPQLTLRDGNRVLRMQQQGFPDAVVWNPGAADAAALSDLGDTEYRQFVCIEPARLAGPPLAPGQHWRASCQISAGAA
jgi:glucose-6-phosphate 1-epimerase